ncbi:hypothetical protein LTR37_018986 [Vermiconidia calcicola]|uniref:Uncharacterized protein n=1 Tax=Vermiconidia calcicola TaxID=1690605 RepID=A0ACC3MIG4_9PEZI|nr:hypothetical protein LTR37_018986 [Vermiconidia calcicola]
MSATEIQALLRFLSADAKVPLATAMTKVKDLQKANLDSPEKLAKAKVGVIQHIFGEEKLAKYILTAARRVAKKRAAGDIDSGPSPKKKRRDGSLVSEETTTPAEIEESLALPTCADGDDELSRAVLFTNRAPLALAFVLTLLKHSMPEQPLSSRLSLAQGYIGVTSKARALYLGIDSGKSAEEEGFGEGQPSVTITGKEVKVLRRWGYEWRENEEGADQHGQGTQKEGRSLKTETDEADVNADSQENEQPPLWALDLEALKKSNTIGSTPALGQSRQGTSNLPIHTPQSARSYLLKAFDTAPSAEAEGMKKPSAAAKAAEKGRNLGKLLRALDLLYESWAATLTVEELDKRTWGWYVKVRPAVADGAAGWGGKNTLKLADVLALRREP